MRFNSVSFRVMLCVATLGFSTSCGVTDPSSGGGSWVPNLPYNTKAYVSSQTCSGGKVLESDLMIDFSNANLSKPAQDAILANDHDFGEIYCNDENTTCSQFASNMEGVHFSGIARPRKVIQNLVFKIDGAVKNLKVKITPKISVTNNNNTQEILQIDGPVTVNFPNTTCGDWGDVECEEENPCINAPESHICTFKYLTATSTCDLFDVDCADSYTEDTTQDSTEGELFQNVRCVKNN